MKLETIEKIKIADFILSIFIMLTTTVFMISTIIMFVDLINRTEKLEKSFYAPVVVTPSLEISDKHTQDIVKQAYQFLCKSEDIQPFDFGYELSYGGNDSNQMLIFVTFYYSLKNDPYTHVTKLVNYYENPQEWEIVSDELGYK